jgi:DNA-binding NtrC family response regulator
MAPPAKLLGSSPPFVEALELLERAAAHELPVLITGESGTGKEAAARLVHARSTRNRGPFVAVNLAALAPTLVEDELFGHEVGAYTGATAARAGRFRKADGGTLFLDEVGDIPIQARVKLLRALEEKVIEPLGTETAIPVDVRLVAATHRDLGTLATRGTFRSDLLFRLAVVVVALPPLRDRGEDLDVLAKHFASKPIERLLPCELDNGALDALRKHAWPGNVRELENAILRARALAAGEPLVASSFEFLTEERPDGAKEAARAALRFGVTVKELEHAMIEEAVRACQGNEAEAARRLGITRRAVEYRLRRE